MMTKKCTCKGGKKDPKCPACGGSDINLDSFHKLNPGAKPKTASQFKISTLHPALGGPGHMGSVGGMGMAALRSGLPAALAGGLVAGMSAPDGHGMEAAAKGALGAGVAGAGAGALHHGLMTGTSDLSQDFRALRAGFNRDTNAGFAQQRRNNAAEAAALQPPPAATEAPKAAMFYEFGKIAAIAAFSL